MNLEEDVHTEFKKAKKGVPDDMWPTVSAFANTDGGSIFLGYTEIKKDGKAVGYKPTGVNDSAAMVKSILDTANNPRKLYPNVIYENNIEIKQFKNNIEIVKVYIPKVPFKDRPVYIKGDIKNVFKRVGTGDRLANDSDIKAMLRDAAGDDSMETLDGFDISDLNLIDLQNYKAYYADKNDDIEAVSMNNDEFLREIGLIRKDRKTNEFKLTRAALLLFGKYNSIQDEYPNFMLDLIVKHNPSDVDYIDRIYTSINKNSPNNIYSFFNQAYAKLQALVENGLIFQIFVEAKLGEHTGSGGYRILKTMQSLNLQIPDLKTSPQQTELILWRITTEEVIKSLPMDWQKTYKVINEKLVVTFDELKSLYSSEWKGHKILNDMIQKKLIVKIGKGRATKYALSPDSPQGKSIMNQYYDEMRRSIFED